MYYYDVLNVSEAVGIQEYQCSARGGGMWTGAAIVETSQFQS